MITSHRATLTLVIAASVVALSFGGAMAQTGGRGQGGGGPSTMGGNGGGSSVVPYGSPGNCPPTISCGPVKRKPIVLPQHCDRWEVVRTPSGRKQRHCVDH